MPSGIYIRSPIKIKCAICGIIFEAKKKTAKYCSEKCKYSDRRLLRVPEERKCELCGQSFTTTDSRKRFCTEKCTKRADFIKRGNWKAVDKTFICAFCGKERRFKYNFNNKFCSRECFQRYCRENHYSRGIFVEPNKCIICGVVLSIRNTDYCSDKCKNGHKHICLNCGVEFAGSKKKVCCSQKCYDMHYYKRTYHYLRKQKNINKPCRECGKIIDNNIHGVKYKYYCSDVCCEKSNDRIRRQRERANDAGLLYGFTAIDWYEVKRFFGNCCAYCGRRADRLHQEHFIPVAQRGTYTSDNIIPACAECNSSKSNRDPFEWYASYRYYDVTRESKIFEWLNRKLNKCA